MFVIVVVGDVFVIEEFWLVVGLVGVGILFIYLVDLRVLLGVVLIIGVLEEWGEIGDGFVLLVYVVV